MLASAVERPSNPIASPHQFRHADRAPDSTALARWEWIAFATLAVVLGVLRVMAAFHVRIDSDEPQHLHVVWAWTQGWLQYRDVFDNHAPLFQMLCAPLFRLFPENAGIIIWMRLVAVPLTFFCLWCVYRIGAALWDRRAGLWSALAAGYCPIFFVKATEFRTDDLWAALWLGALVLFFTGLFTRWRAFLFGLIVGATLATSLKTSLLVVTLLAAAIFIIGLRLVYGGAVAWRRWFSLGMAVLAGLLIVPFALLGYFAAQGALQDLYYCTVQHNVTPHLKRWGHFQRHEYLLPALLPMLLALAGFILHATRGMQRGWRRALLFLSTGLYIAALYSYWPDITGEDFIPFVPLAALVVMGFVAQGSRALAARGRGGNWMCALPALLVLAEAVYLCATRPAWHDHTQKDLVTIDDILKLTKPGEYVMDAKAGAIFRPRPFYYVMETITRTRIRAGLLRDDSPTRMMETHTAIASTEELTPAAREFVGQNYLPVSATEDIRAAGKWLAPTNSDAREFSFDVAVSLPYAIVNKTGFVAGTLDDQPFTQPRTLSAGHHVFRSATDQTGPLALIWTRAVEKGFSPQFSGSGT